LIYISSTKKAQQKLLEARYKPTF